MWNQANIVCEGWIVDGGVEGKLQYIVNEFEMACDRMKLNINVGKITVLVTRRDLRGSCEKMSVDKEEMEEGDIFKYFGEMIGFSM